MLLEVRHVTQYHYERPVRESVMELRMQPQKSGRQRLISFELDLDPRAQVFSYADSFGNAVYHFDVPQSHDTLRIEARSRVVLNQVAVHFGSDAQTHAVIARVQAGGECFVAGAHWRGKAIMRISVTNENTTEADVDQSVAAMLGAWDEVRLAN